ncbi:hypothetical protein PAXRUDRAFT_18498 [Paxillus rubicundulus Ve08.2h10]|uniref:Uncharacterized protein n=1 Tax=Paxillus rubicundulus Ve08.2h10 TaxID=930991 RepID=A0A0D0CLD2_9AGAM|nr:hypothetical protein PAXRUDRAFT_18498 [Paxillus rubicundulus Ve08.2h10]
MIPPKSSIGSSGSGTSSSSSGGTWGAGRREGRPTAVPPSVRGERTPPNLDCPPPSATTPNPSVTIQNLPGGPWPGPARKTSSKSAQDRASNDDARSSPFLATPHDRIRNGKNQRRRWLVWKRPGLCGTEPTRGLQQKYRRSERSSLRWRPLFGLAGGSGCTRAHSFSACKSSFVEKDLAVVEIDNDDLVGGRTHTPSSIPSGIPSFVENNLAIVESDDGVLVREHPHPHPPCDGSSATRGIASQNVRRRRPRASPGEPELQNHATQVKTRSEMYKGSEVKATAHALFTVPKTLDVPHETVSGCAADAANQIAKSAGPARPAGAPRIAASGNLSTVDFRARCGITNASPINHAAPHGAPYVGTTHRQHHPLTCAPQISSSGSRSSIGIRAHRGSTDVPTPNHAIPR